MDHSIPPGLQAAMGAQKAMDSVSGLFGIAKTITEQQKLWRAYDLKEPSHEASLTTAVFGLSKAFEDYHKFGEVFTPMKLEFNPALSEVMTQYKSVSERLAEAIQAHKPWDSILGIQSKAMGLATQLSGLALPKGIFEWLAIHADTLRQERDIEEEEIEEAIASLETPSTQGGATAMLTRISEVLVKMEARVDTIATIQDTEERERQLVKYDRFIAWLGFILTIIMGVIQLVDRSQGDKNHKEFVSYDARIEQKIDSVQKQFERITTAIADPDLRVCTNDTPLRLNPKLRSPTICQVKEYQIISVLKLPIESQKGKWIYIKFIENETGDQRAGWVLQKHFRKWKGRLSY